MRTHTIGIDLGKTTFQVVALSERRRVVTKKKFSRRPLTEFSVVGRSLFWRNLSAIGLNTRFALFAVRQTNGRRFFEE